MLYFLITLLTISQVIGFIIIWKYRSIKQIPKDSIILKPLPKSITYLDVDPNTKLLDDVFESIKLENWDINIIEQSGPTLCWDIVFTSSYGVVFKSRLRLFSSSDKPRLGWCSIIDENGNISVDNDLLGDKVIVFLWEYLVKYYEDINTKESREMQIKINNISTKLKTLNRDRRLNEIFKL
jgi:hypothetical protein